MIHHFYHIYADGQWQEPVSEHIRAFEMGLSENCVIHIGLVGNVDNRRKVKEHLHSINVDFLICAEAESGWEQVTQIPMHEFSKTNDGLILYGHTKGAYSPIEVNVRWRRSMIWHNVINWKFAVQKLQDHGAYGCHWIQPLISMPEHKFGNYMFAGTFFWTHCELMRTWPPPALTHRHEAEGFVGYGWHQSNFKVWDCTPYFPNSNEFADGWVNDINFKPTERGISYG